jgi:hypothetical protein
MVKFGSQLYFVGFRKHKKLTEWARQMVLQVLRWLSNRLSVFVADLLGQLRQLEN